MCFVHNTLKMLALRYEKEGGKRTEQVSRTKTDDISYVKFL